MDINPTPFLTIELLFCRCCGRSLYDYHYSWCMYSIVNGQGDEFHSWTWVEPTVVQKEHCDQREK